jgi:hypothetical protein
MKNLNEKIEELKQLLSLVIETLGQTDTENFDEKIRIVQKAINSINLAREQLKKEYDINILRNFDPELLFLTKQIQNSFDNVSRKVKIEADKVSKELRNLYNKKKLTSYNR